MRYWGALGAVAAVIALAGCSDQAAEQTAGDAATESGPLVVYTSRHYDSDYALYEAFEDATGIEVQAIEAGGDLLIERIKADGANTPPDVIITVDAGRLWRAQEEGLFGSVDSDALTKRVPTNMRHPGGNWFALSKRARVLVYATDRVNRDALAGYESLAAPAMKGRVCARSSGNIYNISLLSALIDRWGDEKAQDWTNKVADNLARAPQGGDSDQIRAVAAGECDVALVNHYYFARMARDDSEDVTGLAVHWPEAGGGVHVNVSGGGVAKTARSPKLAQEFLEFAASDEGQRLFPELTNEYPVVTSVTYDNDVLDGLGEFDADPLAASDIGANQQAAQQMFDRAGWP